MAVNRYYKHPRRIMAVPCKALRKPAGVSLSSPTQAADPGLTLVNISLADDFDGLVSLVGGGAAGTVYKVTAECDASNGEHPVWEFEIEVVDQ